MYQGLLLILVIVGGALLTMTITAILYLIFGVYALRNKLKGRTPIGTPYKIVSYTKKRRK